MTNSRVPAGKARRHGVARAISKMGLGSRTQAARWVGDGRVRVNGQLVYDAEFPIRQGMDLVEVAGQATSLVEQITLMLNKPRGLVTTTKDEQGRDTVYKCFDGAGLPWLAPVGRLDKASEGLLLFSNDPVWAAGVTDPESGPSKTYHVQIDRLPDGALLASLEKGVVLDGEQLAVASARLLRAGSRNSWLEVILDEGRNRQIRRILATQDVSVLRLVRVAIGSLQLGELPKGQWRILTQAEVTSLMGAG